jgi:hypothetical protein
LKGDSLIFHDSLIVDGTGLELCPFTTDAVLRANDMRYGVINDRGATREYYSGYGAAIEMEDRGLPVLELGYQRCTEPGRTSAAGGDVVVAFKHGYSMPVFNTVVANNARILFMTDLSDGVTGGEYGNAFLRTDLLRIRNKVAFYTDPQQPENHSGKFVLATPEQMDEQTATPGMYTRHLHMEPGSELSLPDEDWLTVIPSTTVGGYGTIHGNVLVEADGILAPGYASLMECDCRTPYNQGTLTVHNLQMEKNAVLRISIGNRRLNTEYTTMTDVIAVEDKIILADDVMLAILLETETITPGRYLFMTYGDSAGISKEYVKKFVLMNPRYGDYYLSLNFMESGEIYLNVEAPPEPSGIQRYVDLPAMEGVTTNPEPRRHYVMGHENFEFTATFTGAPLKVQATGFYSGQTIDLDKTAKPQGDNTYLYTIYRVAEPWTIFIGPELSSDVSNGVLPGHPRVWAHRNTLYINAGKEDIVSIYDMTGVLRKRTEIPEGVGKFTLGKGLYVVTLKDGSAYKIVIL